MSDVLFEDVTAGNESKMSYNRNELPYLFKDNVTVTDTGSCKLQDGYCRLVVGWNAVRFEK